MKSLLIAVCALMLSLPAFGQRIKKADSDMDGMTTLLKTSGYELFSFKLDRRLAKNTIVAEVREYVEGKEIDRRSYFAGNVDRRARTINFGFRPSDNDSTRLMMFEVPGEVIMPNQRFNLRAMKVADFPDRTFWNYNTRPFKLGKIKENEFTPLFLLGSFWYDKRSKVFRFCGDTELDPDMSSDMLKQLPHYYIIGITVK